MKHDKQAITLCILAGALLAFVAWGNANSVTPEGTNDPANLDRGEETYVLKTEKGKKPANFPHWQHQKRIECTFCHDDARFIEIQEAGWTQDIGHDTCKVCHKEAKAPTKCSTCHPKKKRAYEGC